MDTQLPFQKNEGIIHIVVVDDHPNTAATFARAIALMGSRIDVMAATSGRQVLEIAEHSAIDILITDMMMPEMNGLELIEQLISHSNGRPACIILITAYGIPGLKETARRLNIREVLLKPVPPERICQIIEKVLAEMGHPHLSRPVSETPHNFRILIADDNPDNTALIARYLQNENYEVLEAPDGIEALLKIRAELPDLILLDVNMPRKDGLKVLRELRTDPAIEHIPVIMLTAARSTTVDMQNGLNLGADDYITKPFDRLELLARIRTKLRVKSADDLIRQRNRELSILIEIGRQLSARLNMDELADLVLRRTVETLGAYMGHVVFLGSKHPIHRKHSVVTSERSFETQLPPVQLLADWVRETRESILIKDIRSDQRWQGIPGDPTRSVLLSPLFGRFDLLGFIVLTHEQPDYFNDDHRMLLQAIASLATIVVENAILYAGLALIQERSAAILASAMDAIWRPKPNTGE